MADPFRHRHFEWLAKWAAANLSPPQVARLADDLLHTNSNFKLDRFLTAVERARAPDLKVVK